MSDHISFEIQVEIIKKLPIKSVIQSRSVSKRWKSVIDSSDFIADYTVLNHAQPQYLLIRYDNLYSQKIYQSIVDDNTFPQRKFSHTVPRSIDLLCDSFIVGTSYGVFCLFGYYRNQDDFAYRSGEPMVVLWNPSIRKSVAIDVPGIGREGATFGFGVCPATSDPKIIKINHRERTCSSPWQVEVYSLSSGVWRSSYGNNLPDKLVYFTFPCSHIAIGGHFYWVGIGNTVGSNNEILFLLSFDLSSEEFEEINLPNELAFHNSMYMYSLKLSDSLVVLQELVVDGIYKLWMMDNGDSKSFRNLFTIKEPDISSLPLEFREIGELMMRTTYNNEESETLIAYEPFSEQINDLWIESQCYTLTLNSYTESLILLNQSETLVDDEDDEETSI